MVKSSQININLSFSVEQQKTSAENPQKRINSSEVLIIGLSNELYRIKTFDQYIPVVDVHGYGLMFFKSNEGYVVYLEHFEEQNLYNLQAVFDENIKEDPRHYCNHDYLDITNDVKIAMNFEAETLHVTINGKSCINYKINKRLFPEPKVALTLAGYSSAVNPIQVTVYEVSMYKTTIPSAIEFASTFHSDMDTFISHVDKYDPLHEQNASFSNIMLTQVR